MDAPQTPPPMMRPALAAWLRHPLRKPQKHFVVFGKARSGSTLLGKLMNLHPDVQEHGELFYHPSRRPRLVVKGMEHAGREPTFGFKLLAMHLWNLREHERPRGFLRWLHARGYTIIHLRRDNVFRQALSELYAEHRGAYHATTGGAWKDTPKMTVDVERLQRIMEGLIRMDDFEDRMIEGFDAIPVRYEEDLLDGGRHQATMDRIWQRLGLEPILVDAPLKKVTPKAIEDFVANAAEVRAALAGTPYEAMLDAP